MQNSMFTFEKKILMKPLCLVFALITTVTGFSQSGELFFLKGKVVTTVKELREVNVYNLRSESSTATEIITCLLKWATPYGFKVYKQKPKK